MFYPISSQLYPNVSSLRSEPIVQPLGNVSASTMPTLQQTIYGLAPVEESKQSNKFERNFNETKISHPRYAPSSISSEEYLLARYSFSPSFNHNMAATREARISNIHNDTPRFRDQVDLLA